MHAHALHSIGTSSARRLALTITAAAILATSPTSRAESDDVAGLQRFAADAAARAARTQADAAAAARRLGLPTRFERDGRTFELVDVGNAAPRFLATRNRTAADSVSADELWPDGATGLDLTGAGVKLGIWDGGAVRTTHVEFGGRAVVRDGTGGQSDHGSHVGGTMIAAGINTLARGMSFEALLDSYNWNSDTAEMASAAASGLRISNHSYGFIGGWEFGNFGAGEAWYWFGDVTVNAFEDSYWGYYSDEARAWDVLAQMAPSYLICVAAGNDRGDGPPPGTPHFYWDGFFWANSVSTRSLDGNNGYDSINHMGLAKNVLTVGAVLDVPGGYTIPVNVQMSSFSCWGPADDGRIKPDICGNGVGLLSVNGSTANQYVSFSGTSMATPNVSGSLGLLVEHYRGTHNQADMRAATLKGLVVHTADECGANTGPDYSYGWGLLNARKAAETITGDLVLPGTIEELTLNPGQVIERRFTNTASSFPVRATICWTDPAGTVPFMALDNAARVLVNDLDLRITEPGGAVAMPWVLDRTNHPAAATRGDNIVDNVEQVLIAAPMTGEHILRISHKGTLSGGSQAVSLILTYTCFRPALAEQPADVFACVGESAVFSTAVIGGGNSYSWRVNGEPAGDDAPTLTLSPVTLDMDGAQVECTVTNFCDETLTAPATLHVGEPIVITQQPAGSLSCDESGVHLAVTADGTDPQFQWRRNGQAIDGATAPTLSLPDFGPAQVGTYSVVITSATCPTVVSEPVELADCDANLTPDACDLAAGAADCNANATPDVCDGLMSSQPLQNISACNDQLPLRMPAPVITNANGDVAYDWQVVSGPVADGITDAAAASPFFAPSMPGEYELEVSMRDATPGDCRTTERMRVFISPRLDLAAVAPLTIVCRGEGATDLASLVTVAGGAAPLHHQWSVSQGPTTTGITDGQQLHAQFTPQAAGDYSLRLHSVGDGPGACSDTVVIGVRAVDSPVVDAGPALKMTQGQSVLLNDGAAILAEGFSPAVEWQIVSGPSMNGLTGSDALNARFEPDMPGDYELLLSAANDGGLCETTDARSISVAAPLSIHVTDTAYGCIGQWSTPLGGAPLVSGGHPPYKVQWSVVAGGDGLTFDSRSAMNPRVMASQRDRYRVRVQVTDSSKTPVVKSTQIEIIAGELDAFAGSARTLQVNEPLRLGGAPTADGGKSPYRYTWRVLDVDESAAYIDRESIVPANPDFVAVLAGNYVVRLTVKDDSGCEVERDLRIVVRDDRPPTGGGNDPPGDDDNPCGMFGVSGLFTLGASAAWLIRGGRRRIRR